MHIQIYKAKTKWYNTSIEGCLVLQILKDEIKYFIAELDNNYCTSENKLEEVLKDSIELRTILELPQIKGENNGNI